MIDQNQVAKALLAEELMMAGDAVREAVERYREIAAKAVILEPSDISYKPSGAGFDLKEYELESVNSLRPFRNDAVLQSAAGSEEPYIEMMLLAASPHWQDRIRAKALQLDLSREVTLPDGFPCIYEPVDSPRNIKALNPRPFIWVASPDEEMLRELLPLYRELWESYENQWPNTPNRTLELGRLNGVAPHRVYRPGATPADVIGSTMLTHSRIYGRAPEHLRKMHPQYEQWAESRARAEARKEVTS